ncbi:MAG: PD40 domain-containing protein, partial [Verrucomicrobia bacterium]|nr:PD40 domain-containing protein [Verrucomicrobiota bacterium]
MTIVLMLAGGRARAAGLPDVQAVSLAAPALPLSATASGFSASPVLSSNGQFVAFVSQANNLTPNDAAGNARGRWLNVFVRNLASNQTTLVSVTPDGTTTGNDDSYSAGLSADGRFLVFESRASNLVTNDTNGVSDIFVRDLEAGVTKLVSGNASGAGSGDGASSNPSITPDGRYVVFESAADDLVPNDTNGIPDIFVRDLQTGTTILVSTNAQVSSVGGGESDSPVITPDGRWVAFVSTAANLVAGVTNTQGDVYARDLATGTTYWVSTNAAAIARSSTTNVMRFLSSMNPVISNDGQYAAYTCTPGSATTTLVL